MHEEIKKKLMNHNNIRKKYFQYCLKITKKYQSIKYKNKILKFLKKCNYYT